MKKKLHRLAGVLLASLAAATFASAIPIDGSIAFNGVPILNTTNIAAATSITGYVAARVAQDQAFGDYATIPNLTNVTFSPFVFSPPVGSVMPLWTLDFGGKTYSYTATSVSATFDGALNIWNIGGLGYASITGLDDTNGRWNLSLADSGRSISFSSSAVVFDRTVNVPDKGMSALLLVLGLLGIAATAQARRPTA